MGVKNLWDILESCKKTLPLDHLQNKRICIDLSCWMVQLQQVSKSHSCMKEKVYLKGLFHRLRALMALNCTLIFVSDGSIPAIKISTYRRRLNVLSEVNSVETNQEKVSSLRRNMGSEFSCIINEAKVLGLALGIPCLNGIEEAEAQCALLNSDSLCDGCFTADSDFFLFGGRMVYRDICLGDGGYVVCYDMADIERQLGFGRNSLITFALLLGSDYSHGVYGLGRESACQIVKSIGDNVVLQKIKSEGLSFAKKPKKKQGQNFMCNKENLLDHEMNVQASKQCQQKDFQFLQVIDAYLKPKCHSADSDVVHRVLAQHPFHHAKLQQICNQFFGWPPEKTDEYILPKIAERDLRRFANLQSSSSEIGMKLPLHEMPIKCPVSGIIKPRKVRGKESYEVSWDEIPGLKSFIVPADLLESACPEKIVEFEEAKAQKKKQNQRKPRAKKSDKASSVDEIDQKLESLLLDIESERNTRTCLLATSAVISRNKVSFAEVNPSIRNPINNKEPISCGEVDPLFREPSFDKELESCTNFSASISCIETGPNVAAKYEIIDLLSPSPPRRQPRTLSKQLGNASYRVADVIELSDSETEVSPEHQRKARELRSFLASIKGDIV
ncbi:hypothetical protein UlMin_041765 [Ulmus minor]